MIGYSSYNSIFSRGLYNEAGPDIAYGSGELPDLTKNLPGQMRLGGGTEPALPLRTESPLEQPKPIVDNRQSDLPGSQRFGREGDLPLE